MTFRLPILLLLVACSSGPVAPTAPPPPAPSLAQPLPPRDEDGYRLVAVLLDAPVGDRVRMLTPTGRRTLFLSPSTRIAPGVGRGSYVDVDCSLGERGRLDALRLEKPKGLPVTMGTVVSFSGEELVLENELGRRSFLVHPTSDINPQLAVGGYADVKYYDLHGQAAVLNAHAQPGNFESWGQVVEVEPQDLVLHTLKGDTHFEAPPALREPVAAGDYVVVRWSEPPAGGQEVLGVERQDDLLFIGKYAGEGGGPNWIELVDTHLRTLGRVRLELERAELLPPTVIPGDLVEVHYRFRRDGGVLSPVVVSLEERKLSPIFFGSILSMDAGSLVLRTLQGQEKRLVVTPETVFAQPVSVGELADVVYDDHDPGPPWRARLVVKE